MRCNENIGRMPFSSLISCIIVFVGVGVFCGTMYRSMYIIISGVLNDLFGFKVAWLEALQVVFIIIGVGMAVFALVLLIFGFLATGATRRNVYSGAKCIMGGRISAAIFLFLSYILNIAWIVILSVCVIPLITFISIQSICNTEVYAKNANELNYCFSLTQFGIYRNHSFPAGLIVPGKERLCEHNVLKRMCDRVSEAGPLFCVAYAGAFCIILGMIHFMITLTANYTRIKISKELTQYRDAIEAEELEMNSIVDKRSQF